MRSTRAQLPAISLGLWQNFGDVRPIGEITDILTRAFDLGITHFDLANNYGPANGAAESNFGQVMGGPLANYRDEMVISTKAGYDMWPGPYGDGGSRKYMLGSLDSSLGRMGLDYVDIFYSHRFDPEVPLEETMGALDSSVRQGKARYVGISNYPPHQTEEAAAILSALGTPLLIHQPAYSMFNRWPEHWLPTPSAKWAPAASSTPLSNRDPHRPLPGGGAPDDSDGPIARTPWTGPSSTREP